MSEKTWHAVDCCTDTNKLNLTLCEDGDIVIRKPLGNGQIQEKFFTVGETYKAAYRKLIYAINEMDLS